jgi:hypothetical protein
MSYSSFFQTLHDETRPVGDFGRGTHYSVLRAPIWQDESRKPISKGALLDFAIIWDEDHDERVIPVIEELYFAGLLVPVRFIGERKGTLSVLIDDETAHTWGPELLKSYRLTVQQISQALDDPWPADVDTTVGSGHSIIHEPLQDVAVYLKNIQLLWKLGRKPYHRSTNP